MSYGTGTVNMVPFRGEWIRQRCPENRDPSISSKNAGDQSEAPTARPCYLRPSTRAPACCWRGHERESGRALRPGMTQTQSYALGTDWGCLMERGQSTACAQDARQTQRGTRTWTQSNTGVCTDIWIWTNTRHKTQITEHWWWAQSCCSA